MSMLTAPPAVSAAAVTTAEWPWLLPAVGAPVGLAVTMIGVVAGVATLVAMRLAGPIARHIGGRLEIVAGLVLMGLGVKIVLEHTDLLSLA